MRSPNLAVALLAVLSLCCAKEKEDAPKPGAGPGRVEVLVVHARTGQPIADANVIIADKGTTLATLQNRARYGLHAGWAMRGQVRTNAEGLAAIANVPASEQQLIVSATGFNTWEKPLVRGEKVALEPLGPRTGRVLGLNGEPAAGARVTTVGDVPRLATTDAQGRFTFEGVGAGQLVAEKDGAWGSASGSEVEIRVHQRQVINKVVDAADQTIDGVEVTFAIGAIETKQVTANGGRWTRPVLDVPRDVIGSVSYRKEGLQDRPHGTELGDEGLRWALLKPEDEARPARPESPSHVIRVTVKGEDGRKVAGAKISCFMGQAVSDARGAVECDAQPYANSFPIKVFASLDGKSGLAMARREDKAVELVLRPDLPMRVRIEGGEVPATSYVSVISPLQFDVVEIQGRDFDLGLRPPVRTSLCWSADKGYGGDTPEPAACTVVKLPGEAVVTLGERGKATLTVKDKQGKKVEDPVFYVNKRPLDANAPDGDATLVLPPGKHVLIVNTRHNDDRAELELAVKPGQTTALGVVTVK